VLKKVRENLGHSIMPDAESGKKQLALKAEASELIEVLKKALRADLLGRTDPPNSANKATPS